MLWPDGIFITKHPKRRISSPKSSQNEGSFKRNNINEQLNYEEQVTASRRAKFVHELIIGKQITFHLPSSLSLLCIKM